ncbi:MAG: hypothetical protein COS84_07275 [Armatimonadetes bacterium CG07_land_8_20_14_0_80_40_9]|nr:MAG: hypothetical protein COS84_07275 [Armatimonadetes bacterium CG07_land_8_20_14_0_80_40_9]
MAEEATGLEKTSLVLLGRLAKIREEVEDLLDKLIKAGEDRAKKAKDRISELTEGEEKEEKPNALREALEKAAETIGIVTRTQLEEVGERIDELSRQARRKGGRERVVSTAKSRAAKKAWESRRKKKLEVKPEEATEETKG